MSRTVLDPHICKLIVESDPTSVLIAGVAGRLIHKLPIRDHCELKHAIDAGGDLHIGSHKVDVAHLPALVPAAIFPIVDGADLIAKLRGGANLAHLVFDRGIAHFNPNLIHLARAVVGATAHRSMQAPAGILNGPSIFGCTLKP